MCKYYSGLVSTLHFVVAEVLFMAYFLSVLGLVLVIEGLPYFAFPVKVKQWALSLQEIPERSLRVMGFVSIVAGLILVYFGRRVF